MNTRLHRKIALIVFILLLPVCAYFSLSLYADARLKSEIRKLEAQGIRCRASQIVASIHPSPQPLLDEFNRLANLLQKAFLPGSDDPEEWKTFLAFLAENRESVKAADAFLDTHPLLTFPLRIQGYSLHCIDDNELEQCSSWSRFNNTRIEWELKEGNQESAAHLFDRNAVLRDYSSSNTVFLGFMAALFLERERQQILFDAAENGQINLFDAATLRHWMESLVPLEKKLQTAFPLAFDSEIADQIETAYDPTPLWDHGIASPSPLDILSRMPKPFHLLDIARNCDWLLGYRAATSLDRLTPDFERLNIQYHSIQPWRLSSYIHPGPFQLRRVSGEYGRYRTLQTGLAVELFLKKYGKLPGALEELVPEFLPKIPVSPFSLQPLQYNQGKLQRLGDKGEIIEFQGYRIYGGGDPELYKTVKANPDQYRLLPVWNRSFGAERADFH